MTQVTKKVLFTSHVANFQKFNRPFMRWFKEQGYEVHYASDGDEDILDCDKQFTIPFRRSPFSLSNIRAIGYLKKIIDTEHYDIIHTHTPMGGMVTRLAALKMRKQGARVIYTAHGFHFYRGAPLLNWLIYYPIEKIMAYFTDTLITINVEDYNRAKAKFKTEVQYVPGVGVDERRFKPHLTMKQRNNLRKSLGIESDSFVMIYPAELNKNKNQDMLIRAMDVLVRKNPSIHLLLAGKDSQNGRHRRMILQRGLEKHIHLLGYRVDIPQLLQASDISVSASYREGLPVHIIEAMAAGLPVVTTRCRGATELIVDKVNGYVINFNDSEGFIQKVEKLTGSKKLRQAMANTVNKSVSSHTIDKVIPRMASIYKINKSETGPIRVLQVVTVMNRAGLETMLMNYYRAIDRTKVQFDFLVHRAEKGDYDDEISALGGKIHYMLPISLNSASQYKKTLASFLKLHPEYQVMHSHLDSLSAFPLSAAKAARIPVRIAHSHTSSFDRDSRFYVRQIAKHFIPLYATHYLGCSEQAMKFMFGVQSKNGKLLTNAINVDFFRYNYKKREEVREALGLGDALVVGHVGRFNYPKNHEFLVNIFNTVKSKHNNCKLLLVGEGEGQESLRQMVVRLGLESDVLFLGLRADIGDILQAMDVFVMPSRYEGLPVVSVEAQASGLPCVFSDAVTTETDITGLCKFVSLGRPIDEWANLVIKMAQTKRIDTTQAITEGRYSVTSNALTLTDVYLNQRVGF